MISHSHKFVFIEIPRCGSSGVLNQLITYGFNTELADNGAYIPGYNVHSFLSEVKEVLSQEEFNTYYKFSIIRDTYSRLGSFWNMQYHTRWFPMWHNYLQPNGYITFERFILNIKTILQDLENFPLDSKEVIRKGLPGIKRSIQPLERWLGEDEMDQVIMLNELDKSWKSITERLKIPYKSIDRYRVTNPIGDYSGWYTQAMIDNVNSVYGSEIEKYKFIPPI